MIPKESTPEITEVRRKLEEIPEQLNEKRSLLIEKRRDYLLAKADYENKYDKVYLLEKLKGEKKTQGDLKALSRQGSYDERVAMISAEANMKKVQNDIQFLQDKYESVLEDSRNYRQELKTGFQG